MKPQDTTKACLEDQEYRSLQHYVNTLTSSLTTQYYNENSRINNEFDQVAAEFRNAIPASFQHPDVGTLPHEQRFLQESFALMDRYKSDMRALAGICSRIGLTPNKILKCFAPQECSCATMTRRPSHGPQV